MDRYGPPEVAASAVFGDPESNASPYHVTGLMGLPHCLQVTPWSGLTYAAVAENAYGIPPETFIVVTVAGDVWVQLPPPVDRNRPCSVAASAIPRGSIATPAIRFPAGPGAEVQVLPPSADCSKPRYPAANSISGFYGEAAITSN